MFFFLAAALRIFESKGLSSALLLRIGPFPRDMLPRVFFSMSGVSVANPTSIANPTLGAMPNALVVAPRSPSSSCTVPTP